MLMWDHGMALPTLDELRAREPGAAFLGPLRERQRAREWALVLQSQSIPHDLEFIVDGWVLRVPIAEHDRAHQAIRAYEAENTDWPPPRDRDRPRHETSPIVPLAFATAVAFFFLVTGEARFGASWFVHGRADASLLFAEPWRMLTALTLHADIEHVAGNALSGGIFGSMLSRRIGPGGALCAIVVAGTVGNALNALYHLHDGHLSIGASTAVFAAIGILAAVQALLRIGRPRSPRRWRALEVIAPIAGGLALLGALGAGKGNTDVWAHGFGFLAGVVVGLPLGWFVRRTERAPSAALQIAAGLGAAALVGGAWFAAMH
jgi:membrane associated rhomboid family serine protease